MLSRSIDSLCLTGVYDHTFVGVNSPQILYVLPVHPRLIEEIGQVKMYMHLVLGQEVLRLLDGGAGPPGLLNEPVEGAEVRDEPELSFLGLGDDHARADELGLDSHVLGELEDAPGHELVHLVT